MANELPFAQRAPVMPAAEREAGGLRRTAGHIVKDSPASAAPLAPESVWLGWLRIEDLETQSVERWSGLLSASEQARATRFRHPADRAAYVAAHALLRHTLSEALGGDPRAWAFETGPFGKPALAAVHRRPWLHFNISHTRSLVACAIAGGPVGVDVEASDGDMPSAVAERFAPGERTMLAKAAGAEYRSIFFRLWTLKEAYLKATGEGLSGRLDSPAFKLDPLRVTFWLPENDPAAPDNPAAWQFFECLPCDGHRLALAALRRDQAPLDVVAGAIDSADLG